MNPLPSSLTLKDQITYEQLLLHHTLSCIQEQIQKVCLLPRLSTLWREAAIAGLSDTAWRNLLSLCIVAIAPVIKPIQPPSRGLNLLTHLGCQRETGTAFVLNAVIETSNLTLLSSTKPLMVPTPSSSGRGQTIARCPNCYIAVWSHYGGLGDIGSFIRVGTLDKRDQVAPDVHIFTTSKMGWLDLSGNQWEGKVFDEFYDRHQVWAKENLERLDKILPK